MSSKTKSDVKALKGQEAEDKVLEYLKRMNRPYGAVDVSANLKGLVPKAATQKILVSLAEKGELVQKTYGKTTFFVVNQAKIESVSSEEIAKLETEYQSMDEKCKEVAAAIKSRTLELARIKTAPSDAEVTLQIAHVSEQMSKTSRLLEPLRQGAPMISKEEKAQIEADWAKWRSEWIRRKRIFNALWHLQIDSLSPQEAITLSDDLGIELDTPEHRSLEHSPLCTERTLKRKR